jgi:hypothetical protein
MKQLPVLLVLALAALGAAVPAESAPGFPAPTLPAFSPSGIPAMTDEMLTPQFWMRRAPSPDAVLLTPGQTAARRAAAYAPGGGFIDIARLPHMLPRAQVAEWIRAAELSPVKLAVDGRRMRCSTTRPRARAAAPSSTRWPSRRRTRTP